MSPVALLFAAAVVAGKPPDPVPAGGPPRLTVETSKGTFVVELDPERAPKTVANVLAYARAGHYDGTIFHRVIAGFMIQGGGFDEQMAQKPTRPAVPIEADNGLTNQRGTVAMARTNDPNSATSQFFVNTVNNTFLNHKSKDVQGWGYTVFGKVVEGMAVVDAIEKVATAKKSGMGDVPIETVVIRKVTASGGS